LTEHVLDNFQKSTGVSIMADKPIMTMAWERERQLSRTLFDLKYLAFSNSGRMTDVYIKLWML
jgi:hypothetical protein